MTWVQQLVGKLSVAADWGYVAGGPPFSEPTALSAMALAAHDHATAAVRAGNWLKDRQSHRGRLGIDEDGRSPGWSTGLAVLAWRMLAVRGSEESAFAEAADVGCRWLLDLESEPLELGDQFGHDATLVAWPWVEGTHAWVVPTAIHVLALKASGFSSHPRVREAVRLLFDRLLESGGANYGNTVVLDNTLRPHLEPTGWVLMALAGEERPDDRLQRTIEYTRAEVQTVNAPVSLSLGLLGLAAHGESLADADGRLHRAWETYGRDSPWKASLIALAAAGQPWPLVTNVELART